MQNYISKFKKSKKNSLHFRYLYTLVLVTRAKPFIVFVEPLNAQGIQDYQEEQYRGCNAEQTERRMNMGSHSTLGDLAEMFEALAGVDEVVDPIEGQAANQGGDHDT